jgi:superfamily I DNA/RNA helicase
MLLKADPRVQIDLFWKGCRKALKLRIVESPTPKSEAEFVARTIEKMIGGLRFFSLDSDISLGSEEAEISSLSDFAVLCRIKEQMKVLEEAFNDHAIPYQKAANDSLLKQEPVRSVVDLLKLSLNPENSFLRKKLAQKGIVVPGEHHSGIIPGGNPGIIQGVVPGGNPGIIQGVVSNMISRIITRFFCDWKNNSKAAFKQLVDLAEGFGDSLDDFIKFFDLGTDTDSCEKEAEKVSLMTLHAAKGLEFKCVFITGCENNLIPYTLFGNRGTDTGLGFESDFEEEKRLLYVGMTRAEKFLYLSRAEKRYIFGREYQFEKSPFLGVIENELIELSKSRRNITPRKRDIQLDLF